MIETFQRCAELRLIVLGFGYVRRWLAAELGHHLTSIKRYTNSTKMEALKAGHHATYEVESSELVSADHLDLQVDHALWDSDIWRLGCENTELHPGLTAVKTDIINWVICKEGLAQESYQQIIADTASIEAFIAWLAPTPVATP